MQEAAALAFCAWAHWAESPTPQQNRRSKRNPKSRTWWKPSSHRKPRGKKERLGTQVNSCPGAPRTPRQPPVVCVPHKLTRNLDPLSGKRCREIRTLPRRVYLHLHQRCGGPTSVLEVEGYCSTRRSGIGDAEQRLSGKVAETAQHVGERPLCHLLSACRQTAYAS